MKVCRFQTRSGAIRPGVQLDAETVIDLSEAGIVTLTQLLEEPSLPARIHELSRRPLSRIPMSEVRLLSPAERQEVWAAGVTYQRSKVARMEESDFSARAYNHVYEAPRPEIFFKALAEKVVGLRGAVGIRRDARWNVPEPELALVINSRGEIVGYTVGNDMSSRDIEGENLLYLPQAKIYEGSCALGPVIDTGATEADVRGWTVSLSIERNGASVFTGETSIGRIRRTFKELVEWLFRSQRFPHGVILLTGTGIVPPDGFTLSAGDRIRITISGIGTLENQVEVV